MPRLIRFGVCAVVVLGLSIEPAEPECHECEGEGWVCTYKDGDESRPCPTCKEDAEEAGVLDYDGQ